MTDFDQMFRPFFDSNNPMRQFDHERHEKPFWDSNNPARDTSFRQRNAFEPERSLTFTKPEPVRLECDECGKYPCRCWQNRQAERIQSLLVSNKCSTCYSDPCRCSSIYQPLTSVWKKSRGYCYICCSDNCRCP